MQLVLWAVKALLDLLVVKEQLDTVVVTVCRATVAKQVQQVHQEPPVRWVIPEVKV